MHLGEWLILMAAAFCFVVLGLLCWSALERRRARERAAYELQVRLVQSAGSARELTDILQSDAVRALAGASIAAGSPGSSAAHRQQILRSLRWGIVVLCASVSLFVLAAFVPVNVDLLVVGGVSGAAAVGLLLSAALADRINRGERSED